jgi:hypothetical protein
MEIDRTLILEILELQHRAIDALMARLISCDHSFRPTQNPEIWEVVVASHKLIETLKKYPTNEGA